MVLEISSLYFIVRPEHKTAFALKALESCLEEIFSVSKKTGSGLKKIFVPVLRCPTASIFFKSFFFKLSANSIANFEPSLFISAFKLVDKAFTTETPTPWRPPEKVYSLLENLAPACSLEKISSTPGTFSSGCMSTGIPLPSSSTVMELSLFRQTDISFA